MTGTSLPPNVYRVAQSRFDAIPASPWVYRISESIRNMFETSPLLSNIAVPRQGLTTANNPRFIRFWWEVGMRSIGFSCANRGEAHQAKKKWYPLVKGGQGKRWFGGENSVGNWENDGEEIKTYIVQRYPYLNGKWEWVAKNPEYYFREGAAYSAVSSGGLCFRWMPPGFICEHASNAVYSQNQTWSPRSLVGLFNSAFANFIVGLNETINVNIDDLLRMPVSGISGTRRLEHMVRKCVHIRECEDFQSETYYTFVAPPRWDTGLDDLSAVHARLSDLEQWIDHEVYQLYGISDADRAAIEAELTGGSPADEEDGDATSVEEDQESAAEAPMTREELAVRWISYAGGIVLGRFEPGIPGTLGSAVYHRADFAVGSLAEPDQAKLDQLVGPAERFAYVDNDGGRHFFPAQVEKQLREIALPDGIAVFDEAHPRDLPALVERALTLMLGEGQSQEVIAQGAGGGSSTPLRASLRNFLERDFFTKWHLRWYRKRPVYWPLQSARRSYGFVLFHERVERTTLYVLQRDYLDHKLNGLRLQIGELRRQLKGKDGRERKQLEAQIENVTQILDELTEFAGTMDRLVREGYEPDSDWIDDGIILRLAPLWELMPMWQREPKKHWGRLQRGDFDWSHIAMRYWPQRVREKRRADISLAIAHGLYQQL